MSEAQESISISLWGFIESRGLIPELVEASGDLTDEFALAAALQRALELGFSARSLRSGGSVMEGSDDLGDFELRPAFLENVEVTGTEVLFEEANALADAVADLLADSVMEGITMPSLLEALAAFDARWEIER